MPGSAASTRCGLATTSLVLGILSLVLCIIGPLFGIPAVICGHKAMGLIKRSGGTLEGSGFALAGLITGYISFAMIPIIGLLAVIAVPNFTRARTTAQKNSCINNLRVIDGTKQQWALENAKDGSATPTVTDIIPYLGRNNSAMLVCPAGGTYQINVLTNPPTCTIPDHELPE
jgi:competence protein ComGC